MHRLIALAALALPLTASASTEWKQLHAAAATATSFLVSNWNKYTENYHPSYVLDDNPRTAWVEGVEGDGEGEHLTIPVSSLSSARAVKVRIRNGYQKSEALFRANAVPKDVRISLLDARGAPVARLDTTLEHSMGWQEVTVEIPGARGFSSVDLEVKSVYPGTSYKDTCISDIEVFVDSDVPYDAGIEAGKHKALLAWIAERVQVAEYFASQPAEFPFAHTNYTYQEAPGDLQALEAEFAPFREAAARLKASEQWHRAAVSKPLERMPDGTWNLTDLQQLFNPGNVAFFEANKEISSHTKQTPNEEEEMYWSEERWDSNYKIVWNDAEPRGPHEMWFWTRRIVEERGTSDTRSEWYVKYDDSGRMTHAYVSGTYDDFEGPGTFERLITFQHDESGKVTTYGVSEITHWRNWETGELEPNGRVGRYYGQNS